jgi:hypothetical protein
MKYFVGHLAFRLTFYVKPSNFWKIVIKKVNSTLKNMRGYKPSNFQIVNFPVSLCGDWARCRRGD